jgi:DNA polymerase
MGKIEKLKVLQDNYSNCTACGLCTSRQKVVFGDGNPNARIVVVTKAPGIDEDQTGIPMVGATGRILDWILAKESKIPELVMLSSSFTTKKNFYWPDHLKAKEILMQYIFYTSTVLCRPGEKAEVEKEHLKACYNRLVQTIYQVDPTVIIAAGATANKVLMGKVAVSIMKVRGMITDILIPGKRIDVTYPIMSILDPAYLLTNVNLTKKEGAWKTTYRDIAKVYDVLRTHDEIKG